jgi:NDP-sugar pyrophosphorylase family protein
LPLKASRYYLDNTPMKKILFSLFFLLTFTAVMAQAPQRISYQSIIRDANKVVVASSPVGIKISLLKGTATGPAVYVETHASTTNSNGLVSLEIGAGTALSGTFAGIDWSNGSYLIQTETDPTGGTNYSIPGIAALNSVPYALNALNAANATKLRSPVTINGVAFDGSSNVTIPATGAVPYTGATKAVDLGGYDLSVNGVTVGRGSGNIATNTANGVNALAYNTTGANNTATGLNALADNNTGYGNTASGSYALYQNTTGSNNTASGYAVLFQNTTGSSNTASGYAALFSNNTGSNNTAIGNQADVGSGALTNATAIGASAIVDASNTSQLGNTSVTKVITSGTLTAGTVTYPRAHGAANQVLTTSGTGTLTWATPSGGVPYIGATRAVDLGAYDLKVNGLTVGRGSGNIATNTASGNSALVSNTTGSNNTAIGNQADVGSGALTNATAIGAGAIVNASNTIQLGNTDVTNVITSGTLTAGTVTYPSAHGAANQFLTTTGTGTLTWATPSGGVPYTGATGAVDLGAYDLKVNGVTVGRGKGNEESNTATGNEALASNTTGSFNTASGQAALNTNTTGSNNTASGNYALSENTTGSNNTAIGDQADVGSGALTNATAIGAGAKVLVSNTIQLGNTDVTKVITSGTLTAGTVTYPNVHNTIAGQVLTTNASGVASWTTPATGLPSSGNTAGDMLFWDGTAWVKVSAGSNGQNLTFYNGVPIWVGVLSYSYAGATAYANTVLNPKTGKIWMDRNLGATQVATSSTDAAAYGDLFQWGRRTDGHQIRTSLTTPNQSSLDQPANINFIIAPDSPYDWRSGQNANLWQGVSGTNNPCPSGYRLPTDLELAAELASWSSSDRAGAFASPLKLPMAGRRFYFGSLYPENTTGFYWSSTVSGTSSLALTFSFDTMSTPISPNGRANGGSVRCIKN